MDWSLQTGAFVVSSSDKVELDFTDRGFRSVLFGVSYSDKVAIDFTDRSFRSVVFGQSCTRLYGQALSQCLIRTKLHSTLRTGAFAVSYSDKVELDFTDRSFCCVSYGQSCSRLYGQDRSLCLIRTKLCSTLPTGSFVVSSGQGCCRRYRQDPS